MAALPALLSPAAVAVERWAVRAAPGVIDVVARDVTAKSGVAVKGLKALVAFAKSDAAKAALVVATAAQLGYDIVRDYVSGPSSPSGDKTGDYTAAASGLVDRDAKLVLNLGEPEDVRLAKDTVAFFRRVFTIGSKEEFIKLHLMLRTFAELPTTTVRTMAELHWPGR